MFYNRRSYPEALNRKHCALVGGSPVGSNKEALCGRKSKDFPTKFLWTTEANRPYQLGVRCPDCLKHPHYGLWVLRKTEV